METLQYLLSGKTRCLGTFLSVKCNEQAFEITILCVCVCVCVKEIERLCVLSPPTPNPTLRQFPLLRMDLHEHNI